MWSITADGTKQEMIVQSDKKIYSPRWSHNGQYIYYLQESGGTRSLMKVEISTEGSAEGDPKILIAGLEAYGFSLTNNNKNLVYTKNLNFSNLWKLELEKYKKSFQSKKLTSGTTAIKYPAISHDGKMITFLNQGNIFIEKTDEMKMQQITFLNTDCYQPSWSPNGKQIAFFSDSKLSLISPQGVTQKVFKDIELGAQLYWSTDSTILCLKPGLINFYILNLKTLEQKTYVKNEDFIWMYCPTSSPDMKKVAIYWHRKNYGIWIISLEDTTEHFLIKGRMAPLKWSEDGKYIYILNTYTKSEIIKVSVKTGLIKKHIRIPFDGINGLNHDIDITPDGKIIVCTVPELNSDVWMIENFDPDVE